MTDGRKGERHPEGREPTIGIGKRCVHEDCRAVCGSTESCTEHVAKVWRIPICRRNANPPKSVTCGELARKRELGNEGRRTRFRRHAARPQRRLRPERKKVRRGSREQRMKRGPRRREAEATNKRRRGGGGGPSLCTAVPTNSSVITEVIGSHHTSASTSAKPSLAAFATRSAASWRHRDGAMPR